MKMETQKHEKLFKWMDMPIPKMSHILKRIRYIILKEPIDGEEEQILNPKEENIRII